MGGKPWTSSGCKTCKKRKLKCDEQKPKCARCIKRGIECLGYVERRIFVHQASAQPELLDNDTQRSTHSLQYSRRAREFVLPGAPSTSPVMRVQLSSSFLDTYFPSHMEKIAGIDSWYFLFSSWVMLPSKNELLDRALMHILIWNLLRDLQQYISKARSLVGAFAHDSLSKDQINRESQLLAGYYADQMARSVLYCVQDDFKSCGIQCLIFCVCQAAKTWIDVRRADKIAWSQEIFDFVASLGFDYANRLKETMMSQWIQGERSTLGGLTPIKDEFERVREVRDMAGVGLSARPGMLGKPSMLDVPELSSMSSKLPDARLNVRIPMRERGSTL
ncbi:hypothetical protein PENSUB_1843 [Penicillium subrubescens]|uniref:Zn(2)-C6 fungal-type domain-containing protein n=1 Tax=Penicillium subrubescens TaxID=1316194 RepID=A0A1Q5UJ21_9EURO|nr:hypothetical protein PENSUB_1843 [Penicillium subrubescens]